MSFGTSAIAAGSMMVFSSSIDTCPSVSERMSRIVASVTKPSCTSTLPSGALNFFCSVRAMFSWSWLMMPLWSSVWPSGAWASGGVWMLPMASGLLRRAQLGDAARHGGGVELRGLAPRHRDRLLVVAHGEARLAQVVEAHREVEEDVRIGGIEAMRLEVGGLRL